MRTHLSPNQTFPLESVSTKQLLCICEGPLEVPGVVVFLLCEDISLLYCSHTKQRNL